VQVDHQQALRAAHLPQPLPSPRISITWQPVSRRPPSGAIGGSTCPDGSGTSRSGGRRLTKLGPPIGLSAALRVPATVRAVTEPQQQPTERAVIRWRVFLPVCLVGLALTALAIATSVAWNWQGIWPSVFLEFGATILLGALLYIGQRSFIQVVRRETRAVVQNVGARADALEARLGEQAARIDTLAQEVQNARAARHAEEDADLAAITNEMTYAAVTGPLRAAERGGAISESFRVQTSPELPGMRLYFKNLYLMDRAAGGTPFLSLVPWFLDGRSVQSVSWNDGEDVSAVMEKVIVRLEEANIDVGTATFDPELVFTNLRHSLSVAARSRRGELERRLRGPLIELVGDEWAFTDAGLESRTGETFVPTDIFPATTTRFPDAGTPPFVPPDPPFGVSTETWQILMQIAERTYLGNARRPARRKGFVV
jgi:hypothetical protein